MKYNLLFFYFFSTLSPQFESNFQENKSCTSSNNPENVTCIHFIEEEKENIIDTFNNYHENSLRSIFNRMKYIVFHIAIAYLTKNLINSLNYPNLFAITIVTSIYSSFNFQTITITIHALNNKKLFYLNTKRTITKEFHISILIAFVISFFSSISFYQLNHDIKSILIFDFSLIINLFLNNSLSILLSKFILIKFNTQIILDYKLILSSIINLISISSFILTSKLIYNLII